MAVALKSPLVPAHSDRHWSPSAFVDTSSCPSLALNSPVSTMTTDSTSTYLPSTSEDSIVPSSTISQDMISSAWYGPSITSSSRYGIDFEHPYASPFSPAPFKGLTPLDTSRASVAPYAFTSNQDPTLPARPRSSPSTFSPTSGPRVEDWFFQHHPPGLGIAESPEMDPYSGTTYPPIRDRHISAPEIRSHDVHGSTTKGRSYSTILPHPNIQPTSQNPLKRRHPSEPADDVKNAKIRTNSVTVTQELNEEDKLLLQLKDDENLPWKDIAARFQSDLGKTYQIPALQMRLKRLRERLRVWTEADLKALRLAHDYWIQSKYEIIASKMIEFGASDRWSARQCARKWQDIDPGPTPYSTYDHTLQQYTSSPQHEVHGFMPYIFPQ